MPYVRALFDHVVDEDDELPFKKGDIIVLGSTEDDPWWAGTFNGRSGLFPKNYVERVTDSEAAAAKGKSAPKKVPPKRRPPPKRTTPSSPKSTGRSAAPKSTGRSTATASVAKTTRQAPKSSGRPKPKSKKNKPKPKSKKGKPKPKSKKGPRPKSKATGRPKSRQDGSRARPKSRSRSRERQAPPPPKASTPKASTPKASTPKASTPKARPTRPAPQKKAPARSPRTAAPAVPAPVRAPAPAAVSGASSMAGRPTATSSPKSTGSARREVSAPATNAEARRAPARAGGGTGGTLDDIASDMSAPLAVSPAATEEPNLDAIMATLGGLENKNLNIHRTAATNNRASIQAIDDLMGAFEWDDEPVASPDEGSAGGTGADKKFGGMMIPAGLGAKMPDMSDQVKALAGGGAATTAMAAFDLDLDGFDDALSGLIGATSEVGGVSVKVKRCAAGCNRILNPLEAVDIFGKLYHDDEACLPQCSKCQTSVHPNDVDEETAENIRNLEEKKEKEVQVKESLVTMQGHYAETSTEYAEVAGQILQAETKIASFDRRIDRQREKAGPPFLIVAGHMFHSRCFTCATCSDTISSMDYISPGEGTPVCINCYHREVGLFCTVCEKPIRIDMGEKSVKIDEQRMHKTCFACTHCTKVLKSYKVHNEKYYCRECSTRMF